jgi:hypothetical protein
VSVAALSLGVSLQAARHKAAAIIVSPAFIVAFPLIAAGNAAKHR